MKCLNFHPQHHNQTMLWSSCVLISAVLGNAYSDLRAFVETLIENSHISSNRCYREKGSRLCRPIRERRHSGSVVHFTSQALSVWSLFVCISTAYSSFLPNPEACKPGVFVTKLPIGMNIEVFLSEHADLHSTHCIIVLITPMLCSYSTAFVQFPWLECTRRVAMLNFSSSTSNMGCSQVWRGRKWLNILWSLVSCLPRHFFNLLIFMSLYMQMLLRWLWELCFMFRNPAE